MTGRAMFCLRCRFMIWFLRGRRSEQGSGDWEAARYRALFSCHVSNNILSHVRAAPVAPPTRYKQISKSFDNYIKGSKALREWPLAQQFGGS